MRRALGGITVLFSAVVAAVNATAIVSAAAFAPLNPVHVRSFASGIASFAAVACGLAAVIATTSAQRRQALWATAAVAVPFLYGGVFGLLAAFGLLGLVGEQSLSYAIWQVSFVAMPVGFTYAVLRHRVIDIGFTLNRVLADVVSRPVVRSSAQEPPAIRRLLVRRAALLCSADLPLQEVYGQFATLLLAFADASSVFIVAGDRKSARFDYVSADAEGERPGDVSIAPDSLAAKVLRDGKPATTESTLFVPVKFGGAVVGALGMQSGERGALDEERLGLLEACAIYLGVRLADESKPLSALASRRSFDQTLATQWDRSRRLKSPLCLLLIDVDLFASFNDVYGHLAGDMCLRQVAAAIGSQVPKRGFAARFGGEEFAVLLSSSDARDAVGFGEAMCASIRALAIPHRGSSLGYVTASIGLSCFVPNAQQGSEDLVAAARAQLASAKEGRNRLAADGYRSDAPEAWPHVVTRHNLPAQANRFVGRQTEIAAIEAMTAAHRLVTIVGAGGAGKTRVALEAARRTLDRYPDGVWFVDLAGARSGNAVVQAVAAAIGSGFEFGNLDLSGLTALLRTERLMLIFDNCEHLAEACGRVASAILSDAPNVRVLATSREPLAVDDENVYRLPALATPDAVDLFCERMAGADLSIGARSDVERIVGQLDGLPLAIELAAARGATLAPAELLAHLDQSVGDALKALFDWSYELLSPEEQVVLRRLSAFSGGWTMEAATAVCSDEVISHETVDGAVSALVEKSLIVREESDVTLRFRFLETTRQYAFAALEQHCEGKAIALRHMRWFAQYAQKLSQRKRELPFAQWERLQKAEFDNYRAALRNALSDSHDEEASAILHSLSRLLLESQTFDECSEPLRSHLRRGDLSDWTAAVFCSALGELLRSQEPNDSLEAARHAVELFRRSGDEYGAAYAVWLLAGAELRVRGCIDRATASMLDESLPHARASGDRHLTVGLLRNIAYVCSESDRLEKAQAALQEAFETVDRSDAVMLTGLIGSSAAEEFRRGNVDAAIGMWRQAASLAEEAHPSYASLCYLGVGLGEAVRGDYAAARVTLRRGLSGLRTTGHAFGVARAFDYFARLAKEEGALYRATRIAGFAQAAFDRGPKRPSLDQKLFDALVSELRRLLGNEAFESEWDRGRALDLEEAIAEAHAA